MPRTRAVRLIDRLGRLFTIVGLLVCALSVYDLINGKKAVVEAVVFGAVLVVGIGGLMYAHRTRERAVTGDWAAMPAGVRRDLPYGADVRDGVVGFPTKVGAVVILLILGAGCTALGVYGWLTEDVRAAVPVALMMGAFAAFFFGMAWMIHGVRWTADANGVTRGIWPKARIGWASVAELHTDRRQLFVALTGPNRAKPRLTISVGLLEISAGELLKVLGDMRRRAG